MSMWVHSQIHPFFVRLRSKHQGGNNKNTQLDSSKRHGRHVNVFCCLWIGQNSEVSHAVWHRYSAFSLYLCCLYSSISLKLQKILVLVRVVRKINSWNLTVTISKWLWFANGSCSVLRPCEYWGFTRFRFTTQLGHIEIGEITVTS